MTSPSPAIASSTPDAPEASPVPNSGKSLGPHTFLKPQSPRKRRRSPESPTNLSTPNPNPQSPSSSISPKSVHRSRLTPEPLTGAAALVDLKRQKDQTQIQLGRHTSPNPANEAVGSLLGRSENAVSRMQDGPDLATASSGATAPTAHMTAKPDVSQSDQITQQSPTTSTASVGTLGGYTAGPMDTNGMRVASPSEMDQGGASEERSDGGNTGDTGGETDPGLSNKALTYPAPLLSAPMTDARRGMSLPGSGLGRDNQRSPSTKKHKCPYCSTEFTRHHNLKSHLLTHSHEKPYYCETCDARFRRLHDLKRHTKLHTGERPHVCPKCDRSFARGDALARHNKGQGGCAGRRSSMGSFAGEASLERRDSQGQDDSMHGLMYTAQASHEPEGMDDEMSGAENAGMSLPSIRRDAPPDQHGQSSSDSSAYHARQPSTYPPAAVRQQSGLPPPQLPALAGLTPPDPRYTLHSQTARHSGGQTSPGFASQPASQNNSLSSHGTGAHGGSGDRTAGPIPSDNERLWAFMRSLEVKIERLNDEVSSLKGQLSTR